MTIAAAYLVSEGVVLGADSSTTVSIPSPQAGGPSQTVQLLTHSQKVFEVGQNSNLGICTWGAGAINGVSHRTIIARLADKVVASTAISDAAKLLVEIVKEISPQGVTDNVGYFLGGTDNVSKTPGCYQIEFLPAETKITPLKIGQCVFAGRFDVFLRIYWGYDLALADILKDKIKAKFTGAPLQDFDQIFNKALTEASMEFVTKRFLGFADLPIREAIDFIYSYIHITIKYDKFTFGAPTCGGPIEIGFVTTDRPFRWVRHKSFNTAIIEQEGDVYCEE